MRRFCIAASTLLSLVFVFSHAASAKDTIVYSARYYLKPGSKGLSHYHLYTCDINGKHRKQITADNYDDSFPVLSRDGRTVYFDRSIDESKTVSKAIRISGGIVRDLTREESLYFNDGSYSPDGKWLSGVNNGRHGIYRSVTLTQVETPVYSNIAWSPNSRYAVVTGEKGGGIIELSSGKVSQLQGYCGVALFLDNETFLTESMPPDIESSARQLTVWTVAGLKKKTIDVQIDPAGITYFASSMKVVPNDKSSIIYGQYNHNSTNGMSEILQRLDLTTGKPLWNCLGNDLKMLSNGKQFVTGYYRDLSPFDSKRDVWVRPLFIADINTGKKREIVQGLVDITGFDVQISK